MKCIYTVSHPITNEVVYVGCTKDLEVRRKIYFNQKKSKRPIDSFVADLRESYLLPKIEVLSEVDDDIAYEEEMYWIRQLKCWGFDLLNLKKLNPPSRVQYIGTRDYYTGPTKQRKSRVWDIQDFVEGHVFNVGSATKRTFTATFKNYCRIFNKTLFLKYSDDSKYATIISEKPKRKLYVKKGFWATGKDRRPSYSKGREDTNGLRTVGVKVVVSGYKDKRSFASIVSSNLKDIPVKRINYKLLENGDIEAVRIY